MDDVPWGLLAAAALMGLMAINAVISRRKDRRAWDDACAEADHLDPRWRWQELQADRPAIPDEQNAALVVERIKELLPPGWPVKDDPANPVPEQQSTGVGPRLAFAEVEPNRLLRADQRDGLPAALDRVKPALAESRKLVDLRAGRKLQTWKSPIARQVMDFDVEGRRQVLELLGGSATLLAAEDRADDALDNATAILTLARSFGEEALFGAIISVAFRNSACAAIQQALGRGEPSPGALEAAQARCEGETDVWLMPNAIRWERAYLEDGVRADAEGRMGEEDYQAANGSPPSATFVPLLDRWLHRSRFRNQLSKSGDILRCYTRWIELLGVSPDEPRTHAAELEQLRRRIPPSHANPVPDPVKTVYVIERRAIGMLRATAAALAAERFRRDRGHWPTTLANLVPRYMAVLPENPFTGQPLRFVVWPDGLALYAISPEGSANGGLIYPAPVPAGREYADFGIRLWDVSARRQPPPP